MPRSSERLVRGGDVVVLESLGRVVRARKTLLEVNEIEQERLVAREPAGFYL